MAGIYIHIPFCKQACHYCDFHFSTTLSLKESFLEALKKEIFLQKNFLNEEKIQTLYFGGGTPSLLQTAEIEDILITLKQHFKFSDNLEFTLEANPDDLTIEKLKGLKSAGINRLSIGIQSFLEKNLKFTNRAHNATEAIKSFQDARHIGFDNISIDLMYGLPDLSLEDWKQNLETAIKLSPEHISAYCLTIEERTVFGNWHKKGKLTETSDEVSAAQFEMMIEMLRKAGYEQYEVSNFCKPGYESKHNSSYWLGKAYLGLGPSAHSFDGKNKRFFNISNNRLYIKAIAIDKVFNEEEYLSNENLIAEHLLTRLRSKWGSEMDYLLHLGYDVKKEKAKEIEILKSKKLLIESGNLLTLTEEGRLLADEITLQLMP